MTPFDECPSFGTYCIFYESERTKQRTISLQSRVHLSFDFKYHKNLIFRYWKLCAVLHNFMHLANDKYENKNAEKNESSEESSMAV